MAEEYMKKTRDTLGKIIKKPPLTDKLLGKPPFRFLHDIFTEVIRTTGFLNGLFSPGEMDSKNVSVKEDKIAFLQKVVDVVSISCGEQLSVRPSKIVAGHEPEKTNELLQAVAKCINKNISSDDAVQQVVSGKKSSKVQDKPPSGPSKRKEGKENRDKSEESRKKRRDKDEDKHERERSSDRRRRSAGKEGRERSRDKESEQGAGEGTEEKERHRSRDKSRDKERNKEDRSRDRREEKKERRRKEEDSQDHEQDREPETPERSEEQRDEEERQQENQEDREEGNEKPAGGRPPRPASAKGHRRRPAPDRGTRGGAAPDGGEGSPKPNRSRPARPPSARPAAPRVRQRPDAAEEEIARMESAGRHRTAPIIVDRGSRPAGEGMSSSDDEDEQFLVQEEDVQPPEMGKLSPVTNGEMNGEPAEDEEHGGLVRKILETKKELETSAAKGANVTGKKRTEIERAPVNDAQRRKEREVVMRDIEKLRASVQKLCRSAVPLGKIIDYIQEDMDSMQNELLQWKKENKEHAAKLKEEESVTTKTIEPLEAELKELDQSIAAQLDLIAASKCNVIRNQEKIDKMVAGVTARS